MARRREDRAITKHTLNLYMGDYAKLQTWAGTRIGAAKIIRDLVHSHVRKIEEGAMQNAPLIEDPLEGIELEEPSV